MNGEQKGEHAILSGLKGIKHTQGGEEGGGLIESRLITALVLPFLLLFFKFIIPISFQNPLT